MIAVELLCLRRDAGEEEGVSLGHLLRADKGLGDILHRRCRIGLIDIELIDKELYIPVVREGERNIRLHEGSAVPAAVSVVALIAAGRHLGKVEGLCRKPLHCGRNKWRNERILREDLEKLRLPSFCVVCRVRHFSTLL